MKSKFERYVHNIMKHTECHGEEKEDMFEELMTHLELSKDELMRQGLSEKDAEIKAMALFGSEKEIGRSLQQSIFPYKRAFLLTLSIVSFVFTVSVYLLSLFQEGDAYIGWLSFSMATNLILLLIALNHVVSLNRRRWVNALLVLHILLNVYGYGIVSVLDYTIQLPLSIISVMMIILSLVLIYQTTIYGTHIQGNLVKEAKRLHLLNLVLGLISIGFSLFLIWSAMLFGGFQPFMLMMALPFVIWIVLYIGQMKLLEKHKRTALFIAGLSILMHLFIVLWFLYPLI